MDEMDWVEVDFNEPDTTDVEEATPEVTEEAAESTPEETAEADRRKI